MRTFITVVGWWIAAREHASRVERSRGDARGGRRVRGDRGDVPGWVMVTVMTAALVVALLAIASPALKDAFTNAINSVTGGGGGGGGN